MSDAVSDYEFMAMEIFAETARQLRESGDRCTCAVPPIDVSIYLGPDDNEQVLALVAIDGHDSGCVSHLFKEEA